MKNFIHFCEIKHPFAVCSEVEISKSFFFSLEEAVFEQPFVERTFVNKLEHNAYNAFQPYRRTSR